MCHIGPSPRSRKPSNSGGLPQGVKQNTQSQIGGALGAAPTKMVVNTFFQSSPGISVIALKRFTTVEGTAGVHLAKSHTKVNNRNRRTQQFGHKSKRHSIPPEQASPVAEHLPRDIAEVARRATRSGFPFTPHQPTLGTKALTPTQT